MQFIFEIVNAEYISVENLHWGAKNWPLCLVGFGKTNSPKSPEICFDLGALVKWWFFRYCIVCITETVSDNNQTLLWQNLWMNFNKIWTWYDVLKGQASISCSIHRRLESEQNVVCVDVVFHLGTIMLPERLVFCQQLHLHLYYIFNSGQEEKKRLLGQRGRNVLDSRKKRKQERL